MNAGATIFVDKPSCLVDEVVTITVNGVEPHSLVTVVATVTDHASFYSHATYKANEHGIIDISATPSTGGTYTGVEPMGLIWSMIQQPGQKPGQRLIKLDVTTPLVTTLDAFAGALDGAEVLNDEFREKYCLASCTCERWYLAEGVERIPLTGGQLHGTLFIPKGKGPFPGVLDMFGSAGGTIEHRSALLASRGIASLALCYYVPNLVVELEYFIAAIECLLAHPKVSSHGVAVIGVSKGCEMAYLLSSVCPKIYASVNICGPDRVEFESHTYKGETFHRDEEYNTLMLQELSDAQHGGNVSFTNAARRAYGPHAPQADLPVERAENAHFLIVHGEDDLCAPPECAQSVASRLRSHGKNNYTLVMYPGAGHLLEPPYAPLTHSSYQKLFNVIFSWGGKAKPHADAQEDLWRRMQKFIHERVPMHSEKLHDYSKL